MYTIDVQSGEGGETSPANMKREKKQNKKINLIVILIQLFVL